MSQSVLDREFLALRGKILEVAAALDRIARAGEMPGPDPRAEQLHRSVELLTDPPSRDGRAEAVQMEFSLPYDPQWQTKLRGA